MLLGFHAFGQGVAVKAAGQAQHAVDNAGVLPIVQHAAHKALVDFDGLGTQLLQERE